jgi:hypothetical protein
MSESIIDLKSRIKRLEHWKEMYNRVQIVLVQMGLWEEVWKEVQKEVNSRDI